MIQRSLKVEASAWYENASCLLAHMCLCDQFHHVVKSLPTLTPHLFSLRVTQRHNVKFLRRPRPGLPTFVYDYIIISSIKLYIIVLFMVGEIYVLYNSAQQDSFKKHNSYQATDKVCLHWHFDFSCGSKVILTSSEQLTMLTIAPGPQDWAQLPWKLEKIKALVFA